MRVVVHLLALDGRPQQVKYDLASLWSGAYLDARKELRMDHPRHARVSLERSGREESETEVARIRRAQVFRAYRSRGVDGSSTSPEWRSSPGAARRRNTAAVGSTGRRPPQIVPASELPG